MKDKIAAAKQLGVGGTARSIARRVGFALIDMTSVSQAVIGKNVTPYIGFKGYQNLGDEVLYEAHIKLFSKLGLRHYMGTPASLKLHRRFSGFSRAILGGGTLIDHSDNWVKPVKSLLEDGAKVFCFGTGVEDPNFVSHKAKSDFLEGWAPLLNKFEFIGVRGPYSKALLERVGVQNVVVTGDMALTLTSDKVEPRSATGLIGICYGDAKSNHMWGDRTSYKNEMVQLIKRLIASGYKINLMPVWDIDLPSNEALLREVNDPNCELKKSFASFSSYSEALKQCEFFIGQKLHATILATMNGIPSIMVEYNPKCRDYMASVGLEHYVIRTSEFECRYGEELLEELRANQSKLLQTMSKNILNYKKIQYQEAARLVDRLRR